MNEEKMKLMSLKSDRWHYRLIKFVFGSIIPDPKVIFNGCAYAWICVAAIGLFSFVVLWKIISLPFKALGKLIDTIIDYLAISWIKYNVKTENYRALYNGNSKNLIRLASIRRGISKYSNDFVLKYIAELRNISVNDADNFIYENRNKVNLNDVKPYEISKPNKVSEWLSNSAKTKFTGIKRISLKPKNYGKIVLYTQRAVALLITLLLSAITIFITGFISKGIIWIYTIWNITTILQVALEILIVVGVIVAIGISAFSIWFIFKTLRSYLLTKQPSWYVNTLLFIIESYKWIIEYPFRFLVFTVLWKIIIYQILWGIIRGFITAFIAAFDIFAEYFSFEYKSFCPGIVWDEIESETENKQ
jgi:hypothetical protein